MLPMSEAPRDGTIVVVYHNTTDEAMAAGFFEVDQKQVPIWRYFIEKEPRADFKGYVQEQNLKGWHPLRHATT